MLKNVLEFLESSAQYYADKTAFSDETESCTYQELVNNAKAIGTALARKTSPRSPIPIVTEKSVLAITAFMGAAYAGCFYVLLDPTQPPIRLNRILETLQPDILLIDSDYEEAGNQLCFGGERIELHSLLETPVDRTLLEQIRAQSLDTDPLYSIFTSGSTGTPKGVLVGHRSVIDFIEHFTDLFDITDDDVIGNQAPFDFDVSVKDIYSTLKTGATMEIIPRQLFSFPVKLLDFLCEKKVTTLIWAVSALCIVSTLNGFDYKVPSQLKKILFSGEVMPIKHLNIWRKYLPDTTFVNLYGPTEITCNCTYYTIDREFEPGDMLPIGIPFPNEKVFLLDAQNRQVTEPGKSGELCVSGTALSLGYYNNPERTKQAFVQNPLNALYLETIYRTGDLVHYGEDGLLYFDTRKDFQIKHMGHRIELGEIEAAMDRMDGIQRVCCVYDPIKNKIVAYYEGELDKKEIISCLGKTLPRYMFPNRYCKLDKLPITKNGKIDRSGLLAQLSQK